MGQVFYPYEPDQTLLLPPSLRDWVPEGHLAHFVSDTVDELDLTALYARYEQREDGRGQLAYEPRLLLKLLIYAYAVGLFSSRKIAKAVEDLVPLRYLAAGQLPSHRTLARFRQENLEQFQGLFVQVQGGGELRSAGAAGGRRLRLARQGGGAARDRRGERRSLHAADGSEAADRRRPTAVQAAQGDRGAGLRVDQAGTRLPRRLDARAREGEGGMEPRLPRPQCASDGDVGGSRMSQERGGSAGPTAAATDTQVRPRCRSRFPWPDGPSSELASPPRPIRGADS